MCTDARSLYMGVALSWVTLVATAARAAPDLVVIPDDGETVATPIASVHAPASVPTAVLDRSGSGVLAHAPEAGPDESWIYEAIASREPPYYGAFARVGAFGWFRGSWARKRVLVQLIEVSPDLDAAFEEECCLVHHRGVAGRGHSKPGEAVAPPAR